MHQTNEDCLDCAMCGGSGLLNIGAEEQEDCFECNGAGIVSPYHRYEAQEYE